jgi:hypothetical protein
MSALLNWRTGLAFSAPATEPARHFEPVEYPGDAERRNHPCMESAPGQAIESGGNVGIERRGHHLRAFVKLYVAMAAF